MPCGTPRIIVAFLIICLSAPVSAQDRIVGLLSRTRGRVEIQRAGHSFRQVASVATIRTGDTVTLHASASAELYLVATKARYVLAPSSRVRVEQSKPHPLSGSIPRRVSGDQRGLPAPRGLFYPRLPATVVRNAGDSRLGPRDPSPLFAVRDTAVALRWSGPIDPAAVQQGNAHLRVRIRDLDSDKTVWQKDLAHEARHLPVPTGTLKPGRWYIWSVTLVGAHSGEQTCGGPLRLLTPAERDDLERVACEASAWGQAKPDDPAPDLLLAQAYGQLGLLSDALDAYESALRLRADPEVQATAELLRDLLAKK